MRCLELQAWKSVCQPQSSRGMSVAVCLHQGYLPNCCLGIWSVGKGLAGGGCAVCDLKQYPTRTWSYSSRSGLASRVRDRLIVLGGCCRDRETLSEPDHEAPTGHATLWLSVPTSCLHSAACGDHGCWGGASRRLTVSSSDHSLGRFRLVVQLQGRLSVGSKSATVEHHHPISAAVLHALKFKCNCPAGFVND